MDRNKLSKKYMSGLGLEIGALHFPWPLANGSSANYLDRYSTEELRKQYPEHNGKPLANVTVIDDGFICDKVPTWSYNWLAASHALEHAEDPIGALQAWLRVLRPGGFLFLAVPERNGTFDRHRPLTDFSHILSDYLEPTFREKERVNHYREYFSLVDNLTGDALESTIDWAMKTKAHVHFHVWDFRSMRHFFQQCEKELGMRVLEFVEAGHEALIVCQKV